MKNTFILRTEWYAAISKLTDQEQAIILRNLFEFHSGNPDAVKLDSLSLQLVWDLIEPNMKRNIEKYDHRCETSAENGKKGGRPKGSKKPNSEPKKPNEKPNNPDSDSDSDSDKLKKIKYRKNVLLTEQEHLKLVEKHGEVFTSACYDYLSDYKIEKGSYKTKSDYRTITRWVVDAVQKKGTTPVVKMQPLSPTGTYDPSNPKHQW